MAGTSPRIDTVEGLSNIAASLAQAQGLSTLVDTSSANMISVPNTTIVGRAPIVNLATDVNVRLGISRFITQQIYLLQNEIGANGEPVYAVQNDVFGAIRFVGAGWSTLNNVTGVWNQTGTSGDYVEITFYGTALNLLTFPTGGQARSSLLTVDGVSQGTFTQNPANGSGILQSRNYGPYMVVNVISGLTLGIHTVKLAMAVTDLDVYGFEMIHQSGTSSNLIVNPGTVIGLNRKGTLSSQQLLAYNSTFESGSLGTKGGRVLVYMKSDNTIAKAITPSAASPSYMSSASHADEEVVRTFYPREFGANRADDFSTASGSQTTRTFTLDDGTTTLVATNTINLAQSGDGFYLNNVSDFMTITFIGTGLDFYQVSPSAVLSTYSLFVDGISIQTGLTGAGTFPVNRWVKLASGLPYGTHTIKLLQTAVSGAAIVFGGFKVYQPVTPTLPSNAIELSRYNIMANYVASTAVGQLANGVLRKYGLRETAYTGTWNSPSIDSTFLSAFNVNSTTAASTYRIIFFGTGFELKHYENSAGNYTISVDGSSNLSGFTTSFVFSGTGLTFTPSTGIVAGTPSATQIPGCTVQVSNMALGLHTVTVTLNSGQFYNDAFDIITPVHAYKSVLPGDLQSALLIGSQGVSDSRSVSALAKSKAWVQAVGISNVSSSVNGEVPMPYMSTVITVTSNRIRVFFDASLQASSSTQVVHIYLYIDGTKVPFTAIEASASANSLLNFVVSLSRTVPVSPGTHKVDIYWNPGGASATIPNDSNWSSCISVEEL